MISRRAFGLTAAAALVSGCVGGGRAGGAIGASGEAAAPRPVANAGWDNWVAAYRTRAGGRGIQASTLTMAFRDAGYLPDVIERDRNQAEFRRSLEDYLGIAASDERIRLGRQEYGARRALLAQIEDRYGVEGHVVTAFWGLESFYGTRRGNIPVISALSTLAYDGRRGAFFESQLDAALRILQAGDVTPGRMVGSWAGAMGHTQFIPTSYLEYAVDFTGDGRRDIWSEDPADALASTANYIRRAGWQRGLPWGMEVSLPQGFDAGLLGRGRGRSAAEWGGLGVRAAGGGGLQAGSIIRPGAAGTPAFLLTQNFNVILRYNNAESYAIGVGHLSDRIRGEGGLRASFGPDATGLDKAGRQELQRRLTARGFDTGGADGVLGPKSKAAIEAFQASRGLAVSGEASPELLALLR
ncbi:lytic murein transglycosylase [Pseudogemmobacter sonorensis]|uniref:lytic murein transglycosylase n=1 Tax=Pseudogemmobacter sonorensis TaxID=2989681 RepID=UPI003698A33C